MGCLKLKWVLTAILLIAVHKTGLLGQPIAREPDSTRIKLSRIRSLSVYEYSYTDRRGTLRRQYFKRFDKSGHIKEKLDFSAGRGAYRTDFNYDNHGILTSSLTYDPYEAGFYGTAYNYDESGKNTERAHYDVYGRLEYKNTIKYDENGKPLEQGTYGMGTKMSSKDEYFYDTAGNLSETKLYYSDGKMACRIRYLYDGENRPVSILRYDGRDTTYSYRYAYKYDRNGNMSEEALCSRNNEVIEKSTFRYDRKHDIIEQMFYNSKNKPQFRYKYKYRFYRNRG